TEKITEITTTVESVRRHFSIPENTKFNQDERVIDYDPFDPNLVDGDEVEVDNYEGLNSNDALRNPELEEVIEYLTDPSDQLKENATAFLQHLCYKDERNKRKTRQLDAIIPLVALLRHDNPIIQRNSAGVLRNLCFGPDSDQSKIKVYECDGIDALVSLIRLSPFDDIREIASATLWNMSSCDQLREDILDKSLQTLVNAIIVPFSGWSPEMSERRNPQGVFPSFFKNATGILRNCSSAGVSVRQKLRCTDNLIPSLIHAVQSTLTSHIENKSLENCLCLLRNLCYRLQEVHDISEQPSTEPNSQFGPKQISLLWKPDLIPCYIAFLHKSTNPNIIEATAGCIQNLTAWASHIRTEVRRANGLSVLIELLHAMEYEPIVRVCAIALRNLAVDSKNKAYISRNGIHDLVRVLPPYISTTETIARVPSNSTLTATLAALNAIIQDNENAAKLCAMNGGIERMVGIVTNYRLYSSKVIRYTAHVLRIMWKFFNLHSLYKQLGFHEPDFKVDYCLTTELRQMNINRDNSQSSNSNFTLLRPRADLGGVNNDYDTSTLKPLIRKGFTFNDNQSVLYATVNKINSKPNKSYCEDGHSENNYSLTEADSWV
ncbi:hypothetical protein GJ496_000447, partial [Pomphorhynchus laevis]